MRAYLVVELRVQLPSQEERTHPRQQRPHQSFAQLPQRRHGIEAHRASGRNRRRDRRHADQEQHRADERGVVHAPDANQDSAQQLIDPDRAGHADREAEREVTRGPGGDEPPDLQRARSQGHANGDLARALGGGIGGDGVETQRREQQGDDADEDEDGAEDAQTETLV